MTDKAQHIAQHYGMGLQRFSEFFPEPVVQGDEDNEEEIEEEDTV